jgi:hypothetical protein
MFKLQESAMFKLQGEPNLRIDRFKQNSFRSSRSDGNVAASRAGRPDECAVKSARVAQVPFTGGASFAQRQGAGDLIALPG